MTASNPFRDFGYPGEMIQHPGWLYRDMLRKAGINSDSYAVFTAMLAGDNPPDDWPALLAAAQANEAMQRFDEMNAEAAGKNIRQMPSSQLC